ncbi:ty3-gypsy retrotransposon protein [Cucumis melo var. makuwa]|uniref:Ty3-gypsy retrotransposon protein n=1 Tax=Cucumis melo var. makuwa TaxID=1194695 RepID=A0A5A7V7W8_CUCMM|nr:ty3-gypsy retrotransposon protein [Cucumis melo var. makuwa]
MTSQGNTSKALSDIGKRPNTRSRSREIQSSEDMPPFEVAKNIWSKSLSHQKNGRARKKVNMLMKAVEERDFEITMLKNHIGSRDAAESSHTHYKNVNKGKAIMQESQPQNSTSIASLSVQQLQEMIVNSIKTQYGGPAQMFSLYSKPYTKRIDNMRMPHGYQPPKFQQFDGKGNPKQHVAHFIETCETAGTRGDFWEQLERDFLNRFYSTLRIVSMIELTATKQRKGEPVIDYINRWRALSLDCKDRLTELSAVEMCTQGMHWGLLYILQGIKPRTFEELATRAYDMELSIANRGNNDLLVPEVRKEKKEVKSTQKVLKGATKEAMVISTTPLKLVSKEKKMEKRQDEGEKRCPTLKERQEKIYPFLDSDLPDMLDQLLEKQLIQLPECKRPAEMGRVNDPNFYKYHRVISHPVEKCFVLKELILKLALDKKIELELDDVAQTNHAAVIIQSDSRLSAIGSLIQFGSLELVVIYSLPEDLQNNDFRADDPKEEEKQIDNVEEGWTLVTRRKKHKQSFFQKESGSYRTYRSKSKSQRRNTRKNLRKFLPIIEESEGLSRPRRPIILKDFFPKRFPMEIVSCHTTSTTEEDAFPLNAMKETPRPEDVLPLGINDLLTLSREVKDTMIEILKNDDVSTTVTSPTKACDSCCMSILFSDEDLLLRSKLHNRPLYVSGYVREQKLNQILIDNGSAVNILPKSTMNQLGISVEELSNGKLVIQGFNQGAQQAIGTVRLEIVIGDLQASTILHVIDSRTTYKMLLGRPWIHENGIVTSTLHQCFKFYKQGIRKVDAESRPFTKAESHFADAKFYTKSEDVSEIISTEVPVTKGTFKNEQEMITSKKSNKGDALNSPQNGESTTETKLRAPEAEKIATLQKEVSNPPVLCYIPLSRRKKGESPFAECSKNLTIKNTEILKENFTTPLTKIEKGEAKKIEKKDLEAIPSRKTNSGGIRPKGI